MIGFTRRVRVFAYAKPADMRKHYDGLYALVVLELNADPLSGDLFLFTNRRRTRAKVLPGRSGQKRTSSDRSWFRFICAIQFH